jgi:hypothetical protein
MNSYWARSTCAREHEARARGLGASLVGARSRARMNEAIAAIELRPTAAELHRLALVVPLGPKVGLAFPPDQRVKDRRPRRFRDAHV